MAFQEIAKAKHIVCRPTSIGEKHYRKDTLNHGGLYYAHTRSPHLSNNPVVPFYWQSEKWLYPI